MTLFCDSILCAAQMQRAKADKNAMDIIDIVILIAAFLSLGAFLTSGFRVTLPAYIILFLAFLLDLCSYHETDQLIWDNLLALAISTVIVYDLLIKRTILSESRFFIFADENSVTEPFIILILGTFYLGFDKYFLSAGIFLIGSQGILSYVCCSCPPEKHRSIFILAGVLLYFSWPVYVVLVYTGSELIDMGIVIKVLSERFYFVLFPTAFFLGNYYKMRIIKDGHLNKIYFSLVSLFTVSVFMGYPAIKDAFQFVPGVTTLYMAPPLILGISPPLLGLLSKFSDDS